MKQTTALFIALFLGVGLLAGCAGLAVVEAPRTETIQIMPMEMPDYVPLHELVRCKETNRNECQRWL